jgi:hypothetical protein
MYSLKYRLRQDYSGCSYTLLKDGVPQKTWPVEFGYNTPAWQEKEKADESKMVSDLKSMGLEYPDLEIEY